MIFYSLKLKKQVLQTIFYYILQNKINQIILQIKLISMQISF